MQDLNEGEKDSLARMLTACVGLVSALDHASEQVVLYDRDYDTVDKETGSKVHAVAMAVWPHPKVMHEDIGKVFGIMKEKFGVDLLEFTIDVTTEVEKNYGL